MPKQCSHAQGRYDGGFLKSASWQGEPKEAGDELDRYQNRQPCNPVDVGCSGCPVAYWQRHKPHRREGIHTDSPSLQPRKDVFKEAMPHIDLLFITDFLSKNGMERDVFRSFTSKEIGNGIPNQFRSTTLKPALFRQADKLCFGLQWNADSDFCQFLFHCEPQE